MPEGFDGGTGGALKEISSDIKTIKEALLGNPLRQDKGISGQVIEHEERLLALEEKISLARWFLVGFGALCGVITAVVTTIFINLLHK